jgi:hypothetical protein
MPSDELPMPAQYRLRRHNSHPHQAAQTAAASDTAQTIRDAANSAVAGTTAVYVAR